MDESDEHAVLDRLNSMDSNLRSISSKFDSQWPERIIDKIGDLGHDLNLIRKDVEYRIVPNVDIFPRSSEWEKTRDTIGYLQRQAKKSNDALSTNYQELCSIQSTLRHGVIMVWVLTILLSLILWRVW